MKMEPLTTNKPIEEIADNWNLWCEYIDPGAEDSFGRWESLTIDERIAEIKSMFGEA